jgi:hypothetical protein
VVRIDRRAAVGKASPEVHIEILVYRLARAKAKEICPHKRLEDSGLFTKSRPRLLPNMIEAGSESER